MLLAVIALTACVKSAEPRGIPVFASADPTATPEVLNFSNAHFTERNEVNHDSRLEWWYHSGHLVTESGREFGFHFSLFKSDVDSLGTVESQNFVAQLGILDVRTGEHYETSRAQAGARAVGDAPMTLGVADWAYGVLPNGGAHMIAAFGDEIGLELVTKSTTPVMLHNEIGWLPTEAGATYYYTWPRQDTAGELTLNGETFNVTGVSWFDHQWGDFFVLGKPAGWQWFALQLDDGGSLMITESRGIDGEIVDTYGTYMSSLGEVRALTQAEDGIALKAISEWTSPETGGVYPSGWLLTVDSLALDVVIDPVVDEQEVQGGLPAASTYWEGKSRISGRQNGEPIGGNAYVELSGYVDPDPIEWIQRR